MSFGQRKNFTVPVDAESPEAGDDAKLLPLGPFDKIPPIIIDGQDPPKTPITPTTPIIYCPQSPSATSKRLVEERASAARHKDSVCGCKSCVRPLLYVLQED